MALRVRSLHRQHQHHPGTCRSAHSRTPPQTHWIRSSENWAQLSWALTRPSEGSNALKDRESLIYFKDSKELLHKLSPKMWPECITVTLLAGYQIRANKSIPLLRKSLQSSHHKLCVYYCQMVPIFMAYTQGFFVYSNHKSLIQLFEHLFPLKNFNILHRLLENQEDQVI